MSEVSKSITAALGVAASVGAVIVGFSTRKHADLGDLQASSKNAPFSRMLASRTNDVNIPASDYFYDLSQKLKEQYVEPVKDDRKLATGAIRGMVGSLGDPNSTFMGKDQFTVFLNARVGKYEGIGADLALTLKEKPHGTLTAPNAAEGGGNPEEAISLVREIPRVQVISIVPGGPADKAGVKVGDTVYSVDGHWVAQSDLIRKFRAAFKQYTEKKMTISALNVLRTEIKTKFDHAIFPGKAKEKLFMGKAGVVNVVWERGGTQRTTRIDRAPSTRAGFSQSGNTIRLPFIEGSAAHLKLALKGKDSVTIDLRNNTLGDTQEMRNCLEEVAPKGQYGYFVSHRNESPTPLTVKSGNPNAPKITLLTDKSTQGMAEVFAIALSSHGRAKLSDPNMGGDLYSREIVKLSDGSGYTLVTSAYQPTLAKKAIAKNGGAR